MDQKSHGGQLLLFMRITITGGHSIGIFTQLCHWLAYYTKELTYISVLLSKAHFPSLSGLLLARLHVLMKLHRLVSTLVLFPVRSLLCSMADIYSGLKNHFNVWLFCKD